MQRLPRNRCLATGYSCRSEVKRVEGTGVRHPAMQALLEIIKMIWNGKSPRSKMNAMGEGNMVGFTDIRFEHIGDDTLEATMPVDSRTKQPSGCCEWRRIQWCWPKLSVPLPVIYVLKVSKKWLALEINANHVRSARRAGARRMQTVASRFASHRVWQIEIFDEKGRLCCSSRLTTAIL